MNKRRREILAALAPVVEFADRQTGEGGSRRETIPGLAFTARPSASAPAELMIYGTIGGWDGINASDVATILRDAGPGPVNVRINSGGGDVFQGIAIHTQLARHPGTITAYVDGVAASAASFIMLAGDRIVAARNAMVMIHDGMTGSYGNAATLRRAADLLDLASANIADMYAERAGEDAEHWRALMTVNAEDGTWYTGTTALDAGLVDEITEAPDEDEESLVWDRLANHVEILPGEVAAKVRAHLAAEPDPAPDEDDDDVEIPDVPEDDTDKDIEPTDFAYSMSMWAWMNENGHTARKEAA